MPTAKVNHPNRAPGTAIAIMAAGKGTRLKSKHPKVLHEVGGKPLLSHVIAAAINVVPAQDVFAIIGHEADRVRAWGEDNGMARQDRVVPRFFRSRLDVRCSMFKSAKCEHRTSNIEHRMLN